MPAWLLPKTCSPADISPRYRPADFSEAKRHLRDSEFPTLRFEVMLAIGIDLYSLAVCTVFIPDQAELLIW